MRELDDETATAAVGLGQVQVVLELGVPPRELRRQRKVEQAFINLKLFHYWWLGRQVVSLDYEYGTTVCILYSLCNVYLGRRIGQQAGRGIVIGTRDEYNQRDFLPLGFAGRRALARQDGVGLAQGPVEILRGGGDEAAISSSA